MMKWVIPFICICAGGSFGILTMCCVIASRWNEEDKRTETEVMEFAGRDREQDREPCDQYDEADGPDGGVCCDDVPAAPETGEGPESE